MFGKHFASMYTGSLFGAGAIRFAVMGYVIANAVPDKEVGMQVELNPRLIAATLGEKIEDVQEAIEFLCAPDPKSRSAEEGGRRLVKIGAFDYRVVNGAKYRAIRDEEKRRQQNREAQARFRSKKTPPLPGEIAHEKMLERGATEAELHRHAESLLPEPKEHPED